jgi:putative transposase
MLLTYQFLLRPSYGQRVRMDDLLEMQRNLYNSALEERIDAWRKGRNSISYFDQCKSLTEIRRNNIDGHDLYAANIGRWTLKRLDNAMKSFFARAVSGGKVGFPRFRSKHRWRSFGLSEWSGARLENGFIVLKGINRALRVNWHRPLPADAVIKGAIFTKRANRWLVSLQIKTDLIQAKNHRSPGSVAGLDIGIESLATWASAAGSGHVSNSRSRSIYERKIRASQRALARCQSGSKRRRKVKAKLAALHRRVANHRLAHLHAESERLSRSFEKIFIEKLNIKNMTRTSAGTEERPGINVRQKSGLNKAILDAGWGKFFHLLRYKTERAGGEVLSVNPKGTIQICSGCGALVAKSLHVRIHSCSGCGLEIHRDINAAQNILNRGLSEINNNKGVVALGGRNAADCRKRALGTLIVDSDSRFENEPSGLAV